MWIFLGGRKTREQQQKHTMKIVEAAQFLVIISRYAFESMVTPCHMTKRNAAQIFRAHLVIYCLLTVFYSPLRHTHTCRHIQRRRVRETLRTDTQYIYRCTEALIRGHTFCIQPIRNAIRNSPQKPDRLVLMELNSQLNVIGVVEIVSLWWHSICSRACTMHFWDTI